MNEWNTASKEYKQAWSPKFYFSSSLMTEFILLWKKPSFYPLRLSRILKFPKEERQSICEVESPLLLPQSCHLGLFICVSNFLEQGVSVFCPGQGTNQRKCSQTTFPHRTPTPTASWNFQNCTI